MGIQAIDHSWLCHFLALPAQTVGEKISATRRMFRPSPSRKILVTILMQQYHRNRHRLIWMILAPLVVVVFILAILNRPDWPQMDSLPGAESKQEANN